MQSQNIEGGCPNRSSLSAADESPDETHDFGPCVVPNEAPPFSDDWVLSPEEYDAIPHHLDSTSTLYGDDDDCPDYNEVDGTVHIRNFDGGKYFRMHNEVVDLYGPKIGSTGIAVYAAYARYADNGTQQVTRSYASLARKLGMARNTIINYTRQLEGWGLLNVQNRFYDNGQLSNRITLLDKHHWRQKATFKNGKGTLITKHLTGSDAVGSEEGADAVSGVLSESVGSSGAPSGHVSEPRSNSSASPSRAGEWSSNSGEPRLVRQVSDGGAQGGHREDSHKTRSENLKKENPKQYNAQGTRRQSPAALVLRAGDESDASDPAEVAYAAEASSNEPHTSLEHLLLTLCSTQKMTAKIRNRLNETVTCHRQGDTPQQYNSAERMWGLFPDKFKVYVEECAERHRKEYGKRPSLNQLIDSILIYDRHQTGFLSRKDMQVAAQLIRNGTYRPDTPIWAQ